MTRADLIERISQKRRMGLAQAELVVETIFDCLATSLRRGERAEIRGFGTFSVRSYKDYKGRNPKTGESLQVGPKRLPHFKPGRAVLGQINELATKRVPSHTAGRSAPPIGADPAPMARLPHLTGFG